jgi:hypothetical protein
MANLIELIARWRDEGATAGIQKTTMAMNVFTNAIGVASGIGMIGSVHALSRILGNLVRAPLENASAFGVLVTQIKAGTAGLEEHKDAVTEAREKYQLLIDTVGIQGVKALDDMAQAERSAGEAWEEFAMRVAVGVAPMKKSFAELVEAATFMQRFLVASVKLGGMVQLEEDLRAEAEARKSRVPTGPMLGPTATEEQLWDAALKAYEKEQAALKKVNEEMRKRELLQTKALRQWHEWDIKLREMMRVDPWATGPGEPGMLTAGGGGPGIVGQPEAVRRANEIFNNIQNAGITAGQAISSSLETTFVNFNNKLQTIGSAAQAFWNNIVNSILLATARLTTSQGFGGLFSWLGQNIGGGFGNFFSSLGEELKNPSPIGGGKPGASGNRINIFNVYGLNTRDLVVQLAAPSGDFRRAQDIVNMRREVGR